MCRHATRCTLAKDYRGDRGGWWNGHCYKYLLVQHRCVFFKLLLILELSEQVRDLKHSGGAVLVRPLHPNLVDPPFSLDFDLHV